MNEIIEHELPPRSATQLKAHVQAIQTVMAGVMKADVHYGKIPGTNKPTLYKAGAEVLLATFRISVDPEIEDLSTDDAIRYRVKLRGIGNAEVRLGQVSGHVVGVGVGECSTDEEKYKWRGAGQREWSTTPETHRRIKYSWRWGERQGEKIETETQQVRTNPADLANTVLKMAKKRAQVDLCLTALSASDVFEQDLDDLEPELTQGRVNPKAQTAPPREVKPGGGPNLATPKQRDMIRRKVQDSPFDEIELCQGIGEVSLETLPFDKVDAALQWLSSQ